jgi:hypothetical protein
MIWPDGRRSTWQAPPGGGGPRNCESRAPVGAQAASRRSRVRCGPALPGKLLLSMRTTPHSPREGHCVRTWRTKSCESTRTSARSSKDCADSGQPEPGVEGRASMRAGSPEVVPTRPHPYLEAFASSMAAVSYPADCDDMPARHSRWPLRQSPGRTPCIRPAIQVRASFQATSPRRLRWVSAASFANWSPRCPSSSWSAPCFRPARASRVGNACDRCRHERNRACWGCDSVR